MPFFFFIIIIIIIIIQVAVQMEGEKSTWH
jgi:hypothetical protein